MTYLNWVAVARTFRAGAWCDALAGVLDMVWRTGLHRKVALQRHPESKDAWKVTVGPNIEVRSDIWSTTRMRWIVSGIPGVPKERGVGAERLGELLVREAGSRAVSVIPNIGECEDLHRAMLVWLDRLGVSEATRKQYERRVAPMLHDYASLEGELVLEVLEVCLERAPDSALTFRKRFAEDVLDAIGRDYGLLEGLELRSSGTFWKFWKF